MVDGTGQTGTESKAPDGTVSRTVTPGSAADDASLWAVIEVLAEAPAVGPMVRLDPGAVLDGDYRIDGELGAGGMGVVYLAHDLTLDRTVAIKLHRRRRRGEMERYLSEAMALARVGHPGVVAVYRAGVHQGQVYIAMEHVAGGTLRAWLAERPRSQREIIDAHVQAGRGLAAAHAAGLIHCDFKPDNVLVGADGRVRVGDFGLARVAEDGAGSPMMTPIGGTPAYMPPEQHRGEEIGAAADQFAFCAALWEALCSEPPFGRGARAEIAARAEKGPPPPSAKVPRRLRRLLARGLAPRPADRFASMDALLDRLVASQQRRRWPLAVAGVLVAGGAAALLVARGGGERANPCAAAGDAIDTVWSPERRAAIERALNDSGRPWTRATWVAIDRQLDDHAASWRDRRIAACHEGADDPGRAASRALCFDNQLDVLRATIEVLGSPGSGSARDAHSLLASLPPATWCTGDQMLSLPPVPPPADAAAAAALATRLNDVRALMSFGRYEAAEDILRPLNVGPETHPPQRIEAQLLRGRLAAYRQLAREAAPLLHDAYLEARKHRDIASANEAAGALAELYATLAIDLKTAQLWAELAMAEAHEAGAEKLLERAVGALALVHETEGRYAEALELRRRQVELARAVHGEGTLVLGAAISSVAADKDALGDASGAVVNYQRALAILEKVLGADNPELSDTLSNLGLAYTSLGRHQLAEAQLRRSLALAERVDPEGLDAAYALLNLGVALHHQTRSDEALEVYRRSLAIIEKHLGAQHPDAGLVLNSMGAALLDRGDLEAALPTLERALAITRAALGPEHPTSGMQLANIAEIQSDMHRHALAMRTAAEAVAILDKAKAEIDLVHALMVQGRVALEAGRIREARPPLERALAIAASRNYDPVRIEPIRRLLTWATTGRPTE